MAVITRRYSKDRQEQTGAGQTPGGARERHNREGSDGLFVLHTPRPTAPPEPH